MHTTQGETGQSQRKKAEGLYQAYINMGVEAQKMEDRVLAESYYQQAEYYLHCMAEEEPFSLKSPAPTRKNMGGTNRKRLPVKKPPRSEASNTQFYRKPHNARTEPHSPTQEATIIPFKTNYLRRKRRETPSNKEDTSSLSDS